MLFPALDIRLADAELILAVVDDFEASAVEEHADGVTVYFSTARNRDAAGAAVATALPQSIITPRDVDDEDWARRSQQTLTPVTVGRITVSPPWCTGGITVVIEPSMGFGTGHHATTRLCLAALQQVDLAGRSVLDVGTGSGVLAIAAACLGAHDVLGIDFDADAIRNARNNLRLNPEARGVRLEIADLRSGALAAADVVIANLTGAVLVQNAVRLRSLVRNGGTLIVSGLLAAERDEVVFAFKPAVVRQASEEAGWVALMLTSG